jgi:hypothetical protein
MSVSPPSASFESPSFLLSAAALSLAQSPAPGALAADAEFQKVQIERSRVDCKQVLGLGLKD